MQWVSFSDSYMHFLQIEKQSSSAAGQMMGTLPVTNLRKALAYDFFRILLAPLVPHDHSQK